MGWKNPLRSVLSAAMGVLVSASVVFAADEKIKLVFPTSPTSLSLPFYVALKKGWFDNLQVEEVYVNGDSNAVRVLISGNADIAMVGTLNLLSAIESGGKLKAIHSWQPIGDYNLVIATQKGNSVADLAQKVIAGSGPGALPDQLPRMIMKKHGVNDSGTRFIQVGGHPARLQAVLGGRADATIVNTVTAMRGVKSGDVKIISRVAQEFPGIGYVYNIVRTEDLADPQRAAQFQKLTEGGIRGARFIASNPDEAAAILKERMPDLDLDYLKTVVRELNTDKVWGVDGGLSPEIARYTVSLYRELGSLKNDLKYEDVIDRRFVDAALKKIAAGK